MKKISHFLLLFIVASIYSNAQEIQEPEFIGESILIRSDKSINKLDKQLAQVRTVASTGRWITGIGKSRAQLQIDGCCSSTTIPKNEEINIIIRNVDNNTDPMSIIKIFKFDSKGKVRRAETSSVSNFGSAKSNNLNYVNFSGKKYGKHSYILNIPNLESGEYGIIVSNPNALDEKQIVISTFAVAK